MVFVRGFQFSFVKKLLKRFMGHQIPACFASFWIFSYFLMPELLGWIYLIGSLGLSGGFIFFAWRLLRKVDIDGAKTLYLYSLLYLALVYVLLMVESIV